jgi:hypothetical protein
MIVVVGSVDLSDLLSRVIVVNNAGWASGRAPSI